MNLLVFRHLWLTRVVTTEELSYMEILVSSQGSLLAIIRTAISQADVSFFP